MKDAITRRDALKLSGLTLGGLAAAGTVSAGMKQPLDPTRRNDLIESLPPFFPGKEKLLPDEIRITFLGTSCIPRLAQECNSIFVEVGGGANGEALDQFIFDCGTGVVAKYGAMGIPMRKMDKIFLTHLHGDHMSDLSHIYCFGPSGDRKSPLFIWGPGPSGLTDPTPGYPYVYMDDGLNMFCQHFRDMLRWHTESFSFGSTRDLDYDATTPLRWGLPVAPVPIVPSTGPPDPTTADGLALDGYSIVPIQLDWTKNGVENDVSVANNVAYHNEATGVKITHFPVIHCRQGSIGYKLEWKGMSMIFTGDTKPSYETIAQASGVTVLIHEMVVPADVWAAKNLGYRTPAEAQADVNYPAAKAYAQNVQNSSHTPQGAFGYILSQLNPPPRLAVATHFQATDDTIKSAMKSIRQHYPHGDVTIAADLMVISVTPRDIIQRKAVVGDYAWYPVAKLYPNLAPPKYASATAQDDTTDSIPDTKDADGNPTYDPSGY